MGSKDDEWFVERCKQGEKEAVLELDRNPRLGQRS
jgi:hypothetical protein